MTIQDKLNKAVESGNHEAIPKLVAQGANPSHRIIDGLTLLHDASSRGDVETVKALLKAGATVDDFEVTALYMAAQMGHVEVLKVLIAAEAIVDLAVQKEFTPLYIAAAYKHEAATKLLTEASGTTIVIYTLNVLFKYKNFKAMELIASNIKDNLDAHLRIAAERKYPEEVVDTLKTLMKENTCKIALLHDDGTLKFYTALVIKDGIKIELPKPLHYIKDATTGEDIPVYGFKGSSSNFMFQAGAATEIFVVSPGIRLLSDKITGSNAEKTVASYWTDQLSGKFLGSLALGYTVGSIAWKAGATPVNVVIATKVINDLASNSFNINLLSSEYGQSVMVSVFKAFTAYSAVHISKVHHGHHKYSAGFLVSLITDITSAAVDVSIDLATETYHKLSGDSDTTIDFNS